MTMDIATLGIRVDSTDVRGATVELDRLGAAGGRTATAMTNAERAAATMGVRMSSLNSVVGAFGVTLGLVGVASVAKDSIMLADKMTLLDSRLKIATSSTSDYKSANEALTKISIATGSSLEANIIMFGRLNKSVESAGGSYRTTLDMVKTLNQGLKISGASTEEAKSVMVQLSQALSSGVLRGDEFNSVMENGSRIVDALTKATGKTKGELRDMAHEGKLTSAVVINALHSQAEAIGSDFKKIPLTIGAALENISTSWSRYTQDVNSATGTTGAFAESLNAISTNLTPIIESILALGKIAATVFVAQMAGSIATYITAKQAAIAIESAHTAAISQNLQVNIARAEATLASTAAQANAGIATQASLVAERALVVERLQQITTSIAQTQATIAATSATIQSTTAIYLNRQATQALAISEQERAVIIAELAVLGRQQAAVSAQVAIAQEAQAAATAGLSIAQDAAIASSVGLAASFKLLLNPLNLLNVGFAALIGWEFGTWLRSFELVRNGATAAIGAIATALENVTYGWDRLMLTISRASESDVNNLSAKHVAALSAINTNIMSGIETGLESAKATATQDEALKALVDTQNKDEAAKKAHEKAAKEAAKAQEALAKSFADTLSGLSLHNIELSKTSREHKEAELSAKGYTQAMVAQAMALYDMGTALEAKKKLHEDEKAQLDSLIDRYNKVTLSARDYYASTLTTTGPDGTKTPMPSANQAPIMAQFDKTASAEAAKISTDAATASLDAYNKKLDDANAKTSDLGAVTSAIFDGALGGISAMAGAFDAMVTSIAANTKALEENAVAQKINESTTDPAKKAANFTKYAKEEAKLNNDNVKAQLTGASQMAGAAATLFDKKSAAAKGFHAIEVGLSVLRLAMDAKEMASSIMKTGTNIMEGASKMFGQSGWFAFAGVAAMLALMAGLGFSGKGSSGGSSAPPPSDTGTGTVLGDSSAKSESLTRTNDLLKSIHASEYVQLRGINAGVNNLNRSILNTATKVFQGGGLSSISLTQSDALTGLSKTISTVNSVLTLGMSSLVSKIPLIGGIFDKVNNFLFGGKQTQTVTGQGIQTFGTSLSSVMSGKNVRANQYADIKTHTSGGLFGNSKDSYATSYQAVGGDIQKALNDVFSNVGTNLMLVAKSLGHGLTDTVTKAIIPAMRIDLMGLSGENAAKKLNNVISATMDKMSSAIFGKIVGQYQQLGEGMFETAVRVVAQVELVKDAVRQSGLSILEKDIISVSDTLVNAAGGLEAFQAQFETYYDKFYTDAEKQERLQTRLTETMKEAALILPTTRDGYRQLMEALDLTNKLDQQRYTILLELSGAADNYYSELEKSSKVVERQRSLEIKIMELSGDAVGALIETRKDEIAALDETLRFSQAAVYALTDANKAVADATAVANKAVSDSLSAASKAVSTAVNDVSKAISNLSTLSQKLRSSLAGNAVSTVETAKKDRADAQAVLNAALEIANSGGSIDNFAGMDKALADISKPSEQLYATFAEYAIDQAHTGSTITQLADYADTQISMAQQQIDAINKTTSAVDTVAGSLVSLTDAQKNLATVQDQKDQIDKMLKNNVAVLSVSEAITQLSAALAVQNTTTQAIAVAQQAAKTTAAAELVMNTANTKAAASASALSTAKTSVQTASVTAKSLSEADAAAVVKTESSIKGLTQLRDVFASVGDWATYFAYQSAIDKANKKLALLTIAAANSATAAATAAQDALTGAPYAGLTASAAADEAAAVAARAAYQTALVYSNATAAAVPNGSHANGLDYVPYDGYVAELHKGERVLTANENLSMSAPNNHSNAELIMEIRMLRREVEELRSEAKAGNSAIAENTKTTSKTLIKWDIDGMPAVTA